jgi:hypothetical protein
VLLCGELVDWLIQRFPWASSCSARACDLGIAEECEKNDWVSGLYYYAERLLWLRRGENT